MKPKLRVAHYHPRAGIMVIGNEVLDGLVLDSNSNWLELKLAALGVGVIRLVSVRDEIDEIGKALRFIGETCNLIITSGGLGPTHDDITLKAIASALGRRLIENPDALTIVKRQYRDLHERGIVDSPDMSEARSKMARMPEGATALDNRIGGAPGAMIREGDSTIFCLPGVPSELKFIFEDSIVQWITQRVTKGFFEEVVQFRMHDESVFAPFIDIVMKKHPGVYVKSMPQTYGTTKTLRVWISAREEELSASKAKVRDAIRSLEEATGLPSSAIDE